MAEAARATDLYQGMVASGAVATRAEAKVGMLGAMYGGTRGESGRMMPRLTRRYPRAIGLVEEAARAGERGEVVHTLLGRGLPAADRGVGRAAGRARRAGRRRAARAEDRDRRRRAWGRFTRNFVVQGTGAEWALCWLADLRNRLWRLGGGGAVSERPHLVFFLHDEVVVHTPERLADDVGEEVRAGRGRRPGGCCSAGSRSTSRSTSRSSGPGPTPTEPVRGLGEEPLDERSAGHGHRTAGPAARPRGASRSSASPGGESAVTEPASMRSIRAGSRP